MSLFPQQPIQQQFPAPFQNAQNQQIIQQAYQILTQLEQIESRHAQMLQQIQADEQMAAQQCQHLRQLIGQLVPQNQLAPGQFQPAFESSFPQV